MSMKAGTSGTSLRRRLRQPGPCEHDSSAASALRAGPDSMTQVCLTQSDTAPRYKRPVRPLAKIHRTLFSCKDPKSESVVNRNEKKSVCYPFRKQKGISLHPTIKMSTAELASSYAALILADEGIEITVCDTTDPPISRPIPDH